MISWFRELVFAYPVVFWGLLLLPVLLVIVLLRRKTESSVVLSSAQFIVNPKTPARITWRPALLVLRMLALVLLFIIVARPQSRNGWKRNPKEGIDIMLSIDVSPSMNAQDIPPTRLDAAKREAIHFVQEHPDDRIGVVVFSGETYTLSPLTSDHGALTELIDGIGSNDLEAGTAIGMGLAKAAERLEKSEAKSKIVILLSDGENNAGDIAPMDAARLAKTLGIKVYTIGVGSDHEALQPVGINPDGSYVQTYRKTDIDENEMLAIAEMTGGRYFRALDAERLEKVYSEISRLEKSEFDDSSQTEQRSEEFYPFLIALLFILLAEALLRYTVFDTTN
ncbi:MAG: VWA domain-containing protein [Bacteroidetes bacterium]|nr:VWA domain-containing protein [Bacteroidota bacterium]